MFPQTWAYSNIDDSASKNVELIKKIDRLEDLLSRACEQLETARLLNQDQDICKWYQAKQLRLDIQKCTERLKELGEDA